MRTYAFYGQNQGISPKDYINKLTDFASEGKSLRQIRVSN